MATYIQNITIVLVVSVVLCSALPARLANLRPLKSKIFARQEVAEDIPSQTPYPPAGIKPEIPFDLPTDVKLEAPDNTYLPPVEVPAQEYGPPAKTYGPPEVSVKDEVEEVASDEPVQGEEEPEEVQSDESYPEEPQIQEELPSQQSEEEQQVDDVAENSAEIEAQQIETEIEQVLEEEGLNDPFLDRLVLAKKNVNKTAKLRLAKLQVATPLRRQSVVAQPMYVVGNNGQLYRLLD